MLCLWIGIDANNNFFALISQLVKVDKTIEVEPMMSYSIFRDARQ